MPRMGKRRNDFYHIENHRFQDETLHNEILDNGDHDAARKVSDEVARAILTEDEMDALHTPWSPK
jgi:hypothetical protein